MRAVASAIGAAFTGCATGSHDFFIFGPKTWVPARLVSGLWLAMPDALSGAVVSSPGTRTYGVRRQSNRSQIIRPRTSSDVLVHVHPEVEPFSSQSEPDPRPATLAAFTSMSEFLMG
jgi:hypothetical protein